MAFVGIAALIGALIFGGAAWFLTYRRGSTQSPMLAVGMQTGLEASAERSDMRGVVFIFGDMSIVNRSERPMVISAELYVKLAGSDSIIILYPYLGHIPADLKIGTAKLFPIAVDIESSKQAIGALVFVLERGTIVSNLWPEYRDPKRFKPPELSLNLIDRVTRKERLFRSPMETMSGS
ncbi:hypothetical protein MELA_00142 [Candidatus Methylomirabilis lanthanidiphila]|uniref:Uncharacterized protein n=1 Tax=Candidatus Methylomirabilis lanthanidiphila TaxID=2211376 RepID=A0A564ZEU2_9BACT|nr:hypothetical protein MELA_00142 [Candidatus Methylomirabilis lanthanidiphila]